MVGHLHFERMVEEGLSCVRVGKWAHGASKALEACQNLWHFNLDREHGGGFKRTQVRPCKLPFAFSFKFYCLEFLLRLELVIFGSFDT